MFDVGMFELLLIMIMGLVVLGPERLPEAARLLGAWISKTKRTMADIKTGVEREVNAHEMRERIKAELEKAGLDDIKEKFEKQEAQFRHHLQNSASGEHPLDHNDSAKTGLSNSNIQKAPEAHITPQRDFDDEAHHECSFNNDDTQEHTSSAHEDPADSTPDDDRITANPDSKNHAKPVRPEQKSTGDNGPPPGGAI